MSYGTGELECGFFETLAPTASTGITAALLQPSPIQGVAQDGATTTITLASTASAVDTETRYVGRKIRILAGTGTGQVSTITAYNGTSKVATSRWAVAPASGSVYQIESEFDGLAAKEALVVIATNNAIFRQDGVAATATVGVPISAGSSMTIGGIDDLRKFRVIDTAAGASSVKVQVYF